MQFGHHEASTKGDRSVDRRWVEKGKDAKEHSDSGTALEEWSEREIFELDLEDDSRIPTGVENPRTWTYDKPMRDTNRGGRRQDRRRDLRDNPRI